MIQAEKLARKFHEAYENLAPSFGYKAREETRQFNPESSNGKLMIAVCGRILEDFFIICFTRFFVLELLVGAGCLLMFIAGIQYLIPLFVFSSIVGTNAFILWDLIKIYFRGKK